MKDLHPLAAMALRLQRSPPSEVERIGPKTPKAARFP